LDGRNCITWPSKLFCCILCVNYVCTV